MKNILLKREVLIFITISSLFLILISSIHPRSVSANEELNEQGIRIDVAEKMFNTKEAKKLLEKYNTHDDQNAIKSIISSLAKINEEFINSADSKALVEGKSKEFDVIIYCASALFGDEGLDAIESTSKLVENTPERRLLSLKASRHMAFKIMESPPITEEECRNLFMK